VLALDTHRSSSYRRPVWARLEIGRGPPALANGRTGVSSRTRSKPHSLARSRERELLLRRWKPCTVTARAHSYSTPCGFFLRLCLALEEQLLVVLFSCMQAQHLRMVLGASKRGDKCTRASLGDLSFILSSSVFFFVVAKPASGATI
jgi:hypothetical protein